MLVSGPLDSLPTTVDPRGERGEFYAFAYAGPMFDRAPGVAVGGRALRDGLVYADLHPLGPLTSRHALGGQTISRYGKGIFT